MKIEEIRLTPEEIADVKKEVLGYYVYPASERKFIIDKSIANTATDKAVRKIVEFVDDYHNLRSNKFALKYGRSVTYNDDGFALPIQVALKKLVSQYKERENGIY